MNGGQGEASESTSTTIATGEVESSGGLDAFLKSISGDRREYERDEGRYVPLLGTFDYASAKRSLDEMKDGIGGLADDLRSVATMMIAAVESDRKAAGMSLKVTYGGRILIGIGFLLQIFAYL
jgi:hypothetical protein